MQELKVIGVENGALLAASEDGDRFRIAIDAALQSRLRQTQIDPPAAVKLSPREVQAHIRAGMSAEDVAAVTGAALDFVRRFEGPVVAEREYMVSSALSVPVHTAIDPDPVDDDANFGTVIRERLASLGAASERWASWKEPAGGWIIKLSFTADDIDHDARWGFEPKKNALTPLNGEAIALSQQGELKGSLIPRLRAVGSETSASDVSRFDSGAFNFTETLADEILNDTAALPDLVPYSRIPSTSDAVSKAAIKRAAEPPTSLSETADLLESLRRRRGEREAANLSDAAKTASQAQARRAVDAGGSGTSATPGETGPAAAGEPARSIWANQGSSNQGSNNQGSNNQGNTGQGSTGQASTASSGKSTGRGAANGGKRGRAAMPSWDEIVFGARTDDDLA